MRRDRKEGVDCDCEVLGCGEERNFVCRRVWDGRGPYANCLLMYAGWGKSANNVVTVKDKKCSVSKGKGWRIMLCVSGRQMEARKRNSQIRFLTSQSPCGCLLHFFLASCELSNLQTFALTWLTTRSFFNASSASQSVCWAGNLWLFLAPFYVLLTEA